MSNLLGNGEGHTVRQFDQEQKARKLIAAAKQALVGLGCDPPEVAAALDKALARDIKAEADEQKRRKEAKK